MVSKQFMVVLLSFIITFIVTQGDVSTSTAFGQLFPVQRNVESVSSFSATFDGGPAFPTPWRPVSEREPPGTRNAPTGLYRPPLHRRVAYE